MSPPNKNTKPTQTRVPRLSLTDELSQPRTITLESCFQGDKGDSHKNRSRSGTPAIISEMKYWGRECVRVCAVCLFVLVLSLGLALLANAQQKQSQNRARMPAKTGLNRLSPRPTPAASDVAHRDDPAVEAADVAITANVRAGSLRFDVVPDPKVEFPGKPARDTVWEAERDNLPRPVEPGVTYRNIGIRLKITSRFRDIDRIVAEALGEVPVSTEVPPSTVVNKVPMPPPANSSRPPQRERR